MIIKSSYYFVIINTTSNDKISQIMEFSKSDKIGQVFNELFTPYMERVPNVRKITNAMIEKGIIDHQDEILNDHVAFRTLGAPNLGIQSLEKVFLHLGYTKQDKFYFQTKKLDAYWYAPPSPEYPRVFLSELRVNELSSQAQSIIAKYTDTVKNDPIGQVDLNDPSKVGKFFHTPLWNLPTLQEYETLLSESEYAAWVIYNRYYLNHYTISVHNLKDGYNTLTAFNTFLESIGVQLNDAGGKIKVSPDGLLLQSSSVAEMVEATFANGEKTEIAGSYVEFAERKVLPQFEHLETSHLNASHRREGFETGNADKIFESTFTEQVLKS